MDSTYVPLHTPSPRLPPTILPVAPAPPSIFKPFSTLKALSQVSTKTARTLDVSRHEIRVVELAPKSFRKRCGRKRVSCYSKIVALRGHDGDDGVVGGREPYIALSYAPSGAAGGKRDGGGTLGIYLDNKLTPVPTELAVALQNFEHPRLALRLWAKGLFPSSSTASSSASAQQAGNGNEAVERDYGTSAGAGDRTDLAMAMDMEMDIPTLEKNYITTLTPTIFLQAEEVLVWLGPSTGGSAAAMRTLGRLGNEAVEARAGVWGGCGYDEERWRCGMEEKWGEIGERWYGRHHGSSHSSLGSSNDTNTPSGSDASTASDSRRGSTMGISSGAGGGNAPVVRGSDHYDGTTRMILSRPWFHRVESLREAGGNDNVHFVWGDVSIPKVILWDAVVTLSHISRAVGAERRMSLNPILGMNGLLNSGGGCSRSGSGSSTGSGGVGGEDGGGRGGGRIGLGRSSTSASVSTSLLLVLPPPETVGEIDVVAQRTLDFIVQPAVDTLEGLLMFTSAGVGRGDGFGVDGDARDRVFALLGLARDAEALGLRANYGKTAAEVYHEVSEAVLKHATSLSVLCVCGGKKNVEGLPSWVPDWSVPLPSILGCRINGGGVFCASGRDAEPRIAFKASAEGKSLLLAMGSRFDTVHDVLETRWDAEWEVGDFEEGTPAIGFLDDVNDFVAESVTAYGVGAERFDAVWRTPIVDSDAHFLELRNGVDDHVLVPRARASPRMRRAFEALIGGVSEEALEDCEWRRAASKPYVDVLKREAPKRRLFATERGYFGLGYEDVRPGDEVCVLQGGDSPFLLRPVQGELGKVTYEVVGEAYVYGIMNGEFVRTNPVTHMFTLE